MDEKILDIASTWSEFEHYQKLCLYLYMVELINKIDGERPLGSKLTMSEFNNDSVILAKLIYFYMISNDDIKNRYCSIYKNFKQQYVS